MGIPPTEHLQGILERMMYHVEDSGYPVTRLKVPSSRGLITIMGSFPDIQYSREEREFSPAPGRIYISSYRFFISNMPTFRSLGQRFLAMTSCIYELASKIA